MRTLSLKKRAEDGFIISNVTLERRIEKCQRMLSEIESAIPNRIVRFERDIKEPKKAYLFLGETRISDRLNRHKKTTGESL